MCRLLCHPLTGFTAALPRLPILHCTLLPYLHYLPDYCTCIHPFILYSIHYFPTSCILLYLSASCTLLLALYLSSQPLYPCLFCSPASCISLFSEGEDKVTQQLCPSYVCTVKIKMNEILLPQSIKQPFEYDFICARELFKVCLLHSFSHWKLGSSLLLFIPISFLSF